MGKEMKTKNTEMWENISIGVVKKYVEAFDINYQKSENIITQTFRDNSYSVDVVEKRIHFLNGYYHTRVPVEPMRDSIIYLHRSEKLDELIKVGAEEAVIIIADCEGKNYFSFATKYCCFANPDKYPIYDSMSIKALERFNYYMYFYEDEIDFEKMRIAKEYEKYRNIVNKFREKIKLEDEELNYKNLDKFLWLTGKNI